MQIREYCLDRSCDQIRTDQTPLCHECWNCVPLMIMLMNDTWINQFYCQSKRLCPDHFSSSSSRKSHLLQKWRFLWGKKLSRPFPSLSGNVRHFPLQTRAIHTQADLMTWIQEHATHDRWLQAHKNRWWLTPCTAGLNGFQVTRFVPIVLGNFWATFGVWSNFLRF